MSKSFFVYLLAGGGYTFLFFLFHSMGCPYDMNPLCFFECVSPLVLLAPLAFMDDDEWNH